MINLAGKKDCDKYIIEELSSAGITPDSLEVSNHPEVKSLYKGRLLGWTFSRQWYYWSASCEDAFQYGLDLKYASPLHALVGQEVRLAGHCGCPSPDDGFWMDKFDEDGNELISQEEMDKCKKKAESSDLMRKTYESLLISHRSVPDTLKYASENGKIIASSYHIDSQIGLEMFCLVLRKQAEDKAVLEAQLKNIIKREEFISKRIEIIDYFKIKNQNPNDIFTCPKDKSHGQMSVYKDESEGHVIGFDIKCSTCDGRQWGGGFKVDEVVKIYESRKKD